MIVLQKYWRRWLALRYVTKLKVDRQRRLDWEKQEEVKKREEKELRIKREFERRMNPKTKEDFDLLYAALESMYSKLSLAAALFIAHRLV